jgi:hypothetical protein
VRENERKKNKRKRWRRGRRKKKKSRSSRRGSEISQCGNTRASLSSCSIKRTPSSTDYPDTNRIIKAGLDTKLRPKKKIGSQRWRRWLWQGGGYGISSRHPRVTEALRNDLSGTYISSAFSIFFSSPPPPSRPLTPTSALAYRQLSSRSPPCVLHGTHARTHAGTLPPTPGTRVIFASKGQRERERERERERSAFLHRCGFHSCATRRHDCRFLASVLGRLSNRQGGPSFRSS